MLYKHLSILCMLASMLPIGLSMDTDNKFTMVCEKPATLHSCKLSCDCLDGRNSKPDCSEPVCHDNCRCREQTPPPAYIKGDTAPPPYQKSPGRSRSSSPSSSRSRTGRPTTKRDQIFHQIEARDAYIDHLESILFAREAEPEPEPEEDELVGWY